MRQSVCTEHVLSVSSFKGILSNSNLDHALKKVMGDFPGGPGVKTVLPLQGTHV